MRPILASAAILFACMKCAIVPAYGRQLGASTPPAEAPKYTVTGIVVNAVTGEPIPRALVRLQTGQQQLAMTGIDGRFQITDAPSGIFTVTAEKPGFFSPQQVNSQRYGSSYSFVRLDKDTDSITVKLLPAASIVGRVVDQNSEPLENITILVLVRHHANGRARWDQVNQSQTDDDGTYRVGNLVPGDYYVATGPHARRALNAGGRPDGQNFDEIYPITYFPGSASQTGATQISLTPGQEATADFNLSVEKAYRISGSITSPGPPQQVMLQLLDSDGKILQTPLRRDTGSGFQFSDVPPGAYTIFGIYRDQNTVYAVNQPVNIGSTDVINVPAVLSPGASIPIHIQFDREPPVTQKGLVAAVTLVPESNNPFQVGGTTTWIPESNSLLLSGIAPGKYSVRVNVLNSSYYLVSATCGSLDLNREDLVIGSGSSPAPIELVLNTGAITVKGTVKNGDIPAEASVMLLPETPRAEEPRIVRSDSNGKFQMEGLAPGDYRAYAYFGSDGLEYRNADVMKGYQDWATEVSVEPNQQPDITVRVISGAGQ